MIVSASTDASETMLGELKRLEIRNDSLSNPLVPIIALTISGVVIMVIVITPLAILRRRRRVKTDIEEDSGT